MANPFNQFASGYDEGTGMARDIASLSAGNALSQGDYGGAANALYKSGQLGQGAAVQTMGQNQQEHIDALHKQEVADRAQFFLKAASALAQIPDPDQTQTARHQALQHLIPTFQAMGIGDQDIAKLQQADLSDASLQMFGAQLQKELQGFTLNQGQTRFDARGQPIASVAPEQKYVTLQEGAKAIPIPGTGQARPTGTLSLPQAAPPTSAPVGDPRQAVDALVSATGAQITSAMRSPEHNAEVGGVPNSLHLVDQARDLVPPPNMTIAQLANAARKAVPGAKIIPEKDHVHIQWGVSGGGAPTVPGDPTGTLYGNPKADEPALSPAAVAMVGQQYLSLGPPALQNMGQGKAGIANKAKVMEWVAKTAAEAGTSNPQLVARFAQNKANMAALTQNTKTLTALTGSEQTLDKNLDYALTLAKKGGVGPTGIPLVDTPIQKARMALGSVDAKNLDNMLITTGNEYARILTTPTGTGGSATSDAARAEAHKLINSGMSLNQIIGAIQTAKLEAHNRRISALNENKQLTSDISGVPQVTSQTQTTAPNIIRYDAQGRRVQ